ncbi:2OG-Fe(II) oxygenase [Pontibacter chitinilyticus]|uniref:2OG-Fe(II) oxygenase n=1 Tax=Pontibacter chitinilyticus TaxID=2674989 RepID=UPI003219F6E2
MMYIDMVSLVKRQAALTAAFNAKEPFRYLVLEDFFISERAEEILAAYPAIKSGTWDGTTYIDQKNKFQQRDFAEGSLFACVFAELNAPKFLTWLEELTGITALTGDPALFGGGLHQSTQGAFLNVHVDYNVHPQTKYHRRLNVLVYLNKDWQDTYNGHLELWDMSQKRLLDRIAPTFNRCVIFETNEISYHGHPSLLQTPAGISRKSIATYYYTPTRPETELASDHNTRFVNTEGMAGQLKRFKAGLKALLERTC